MSFTSPGFFLFLPVVLLGFALLPARGRVVWLILASLAFYGGVAPSDLAYLGGVAVVGLGAGLGAGRAATDSARKVWVRSGAGLLIAALVVLKFHDALLPNLGLRPLASGPPAGYSFYTFMVVAHLLDIGRGKIAPPAPAHYLLYVTWFPKILAGPIERSTRFIPQIPQALRLRPDLALAGVVLVLGGLIKKLVIADNLAPVVDAAFAIPAYAAPLDLIIAAYFFAFQIYCDFSGYSDIAIGLSALFGLALSRNFHHAYLSQTVSGFWSDRWHITLGAWFRDYVYVPLGGSHKGVIRQVINLMFVFAISGLWHAGLGYGVGWGFLVWGLLNGLYVSVGVVGRRITTSPIGGTSRIMAVLRVLLTFHLIGLSWVFFRAETLADATTILTRIWQALPSLPALVPHYPFSADHRLGAALILGLLAVELASERTPLSERLAQWPRAARWSVWYAGLALVLVLGRWQGDGFIYMQF